MFEVINISLADQQELKVRLKKLKDIAPDADIRFDQKVSRYYICLGEYQTMPLAEQKAKEFRNKKIYAGVKLD